MKSENFVNFTGCTIYFKRCQMFCKEHIFLQSGVSLNLSHTLISTYFRCHLLRLKAICFVFYRATFALKITFDQWSSVMTNCENSKNQEWKLSAQAFHQHSILIINCKCRIWDTSKELRAMQIICFLEVLVSVSTEVTMCYDIIYIKLKNNILIIKGDNHCKLWATFLQNWVN